MQQKNKKACKKYYDNQMTERLSGKNRKNRKDVLTAQTKLHLQHF